MVCEQLVELCVSSVDGVGLKRVVQQKGCSIIEMGLYRLMLVNSWFAEV
jgi:hypothetical protein